MNSPVLVKRSEHTEAVTLANYLLYLQRLGKIELYSHLPHETYTTSWNARRKNMQEGTRRGVPDYIIIAGNDVIFLELKTLKGGYPSPEQKEWLLHLPGKTTHAYLAKGFDMAKTFIDSHIK